ncbi:O-methyltransferase [Cohnella yongneupensis]|uniref:O-methyltransferase n=2 Tax=Cohnella yongneupensis TaxID=425006 RepID=A0ABW0R156_9BACL
MDQISLARQVNVALEQLEAELKGLTAGTIVLQIREDKVGRFGIRHLPLDCGSQQPNHAGGLTATQAKQLRVMAVEALRHKRTWTHGEIAYDFALRQGQIYVSVQFESNYNMANVFFRPPAPKRDRKEISGE